jgi:hypothetical protein
MYRPSSQAVTFHVERARVTGSAIGRPPAPTYWHYLRGGQQVVKREKLGGGGGHIDLIREEDTKRLQNVGMLLHFDTGTTFL